jgi:hypothetical protein
MDCRLLVAIPHDGLVVSTREETIVTHTNESVVLHEDAPHFKSLTRRSHRCKLCGLHEVVLPGDSGSHI